MIFDREEELLLEKASTANRERDADGRVVPSGAWFDLPPDKREAAFDEIARLRRLEQALDPDGMSTTARAVLQRIRR